MTAKSLKPSGSRASMLYVTCGSREDAVAIARVVVGERLAACANIFDYMRSVYWWQGELNEDSETVLLLKTTTERVAELTERIKTLHAYGLPCVVEIPLGGGNAAYFDWIAAETAQRRR